MISRKWCDGLTWNDPLTKLCGIELHTLPCLPKLFISHFYVFLSHHSSILETNRIPCMLIFGSRMGEMMVILLQKEEENLSVSLSLLHILQLSEIHSWRLGNMGSKGLWLLVKTTSLIFTQREGLLPLEEAYNILCTHVGYLCIVHSPGVNAIQILFLLTTFHHNINESLH